MKNLWILSVLSLMLLTSCANQRHVNQFYNKYQGTENTLSFKAPMFLTSVLMNDSEAYHIFKNKIKSIRVLTMNELSEQRYTTVEQDIKNALQQDGFENWFSLNKDGTVIQVSAQNRGKSLRNLVISMQGDDNLIFLNAKTNLTEKELTQFITEYIENKK